jgi:hypothetical protein
VIDAKYDSLSGGWGSTEVIGLFGIGVWKCIRRGGILFQNLVDMR